VIVFRVRIIASQTKKSEVITFFSLQWRSIKISPLLPEKKNEAPTKKKKKKNSRSFYFIKAEPSLFFRAIVFHRAKSSVLNTKKSNLGSRSIG
jgi:hypothetical protein